MSNKFYRLFLGDTETWLLPELALFLPESHCLVIADWHLGKTTHFRKNGIFLPKTSLYKEFMKLDALLAKYAVKTVVFLGDLFHSEWNTDWELFKEALLKHNTVSFILTKGNHDIIDYEQHHLPHFKIVKELWLNEKIVFSHQSLSLSNKDVINIVGHTHPGISIRTRQRHYFRLPCFYFDTGVFILPAFGDLTGLYIMERKRGDEVFIVLGDEVKRLKNT